MSAEKTKESEEVIAAEVETCPCAEPCEHAEQLQSALIQYLEHDVFKEHPIASGGGVAVLVGAGFWLLRAWRKRK